MKKELFREQLQNYVRQDLKCKFEDVKAKELSNVLVQPEMESRRFR